MKIFNVLLEDANEEVMVQTPPGCAGFLCCSRTADAFRFSNVATAAAIGSGEGADADALPYVSISADPPLPFETSRIELGQGKLYFASATVPQTIEVICY